jgi:hypothetical protein
MLLVCFTPELKEKLERAGYRQLRATTHLGKPAWVFLNAPENPPVYQSEDPSSYLLTTKMQF